MTTRLRSHKHRNTGLSLLELLVALTVLAVGLLGMLAMQTQALRGSQHGKHVSEAARFAEEQVEFLHRQPWANIPESSWNLPRSVNGSVNGTGPSAPQQYSVSYRVLAGPDPDLRLIDVSVTWTMPQAPPGAQDRVYNVSSLRHRDPGTP
jgi:prepilin-type N-terminal cleavage/methylation domain-containing protein